MTFGDDLRALWMSIGEIAIPIAELRDEYVQFPGIHRRFSQLHEVYNNLRSIEVALFEFMELKKPFMGNKPEREFLMISRASVENAFVLLEIGKAEFAMLASK